MLAVDSNVGGVLNDLDLGGQLELCKRPAAIVRPVTGTCSCGWSAAFLETPVLWVNHGHARVWLTV